MRVNLNDLLAAVSSALDAVEYEFYGARKYHARRVAMVSVGMLEDLWWRAVPGGVLAARGVAARGTMAARVGGALAKAEAEGKLPKPVTPKGELPPRPTQRGLPNPLQLVEQPQLPRLATAQLPTADMAELAASLDSPEYVDLPHLVDLTDLVRPEASASAARPGRRSTPIAWSRSSPRPRCTTAGSPATTATWARRSRARSCGVMWPRRPQGPRRASLVTSVASQSRS